MIITIPSIAFRLLLIAFKLLLDASYILFVSPQFGYAGFNLVLDPFIYLESWALYILMILFLRHYLKRPSDFLIFLFMVITVAPMLSLYGLSEQDSLYTYFVIIVYFIFVFIQRGPDLRIPYIKYGSQLTILISLLFIIVVLAKMAAGGTLFRINFDFSQVYTFRKEVGSTLFDGIWGYIVTWMMKIFTLTVLAYSLLKKKYFISFLLVLFQILLFGITSHKAVAFYPIFAISLYLFRNSKNILLLMSSSLVGLLLLCLGSFLIFDDRFLSSYLIRRVFFLPALLKYQYYDFFSHNGFVYWSDSIFSGFINYPFPLEADNLIAAVYHGRPEMNANTGFIATSYMNFGFPGMVFLGLVVALLMKFVDSFSKGDKPSWFYLSFLSVPFFGLFASSALLTILLTHGLGVGLLMAWLSYSKPINKNLLKAVH